MGTQGQKRLDALNQLLNGDANDAKGDLDDAVRQKIQELQGEIVSNGRCSDDDADIESIQAGAADIASNLMLDPSPLDFTDAVSTVGRLSSRLKQKLQAQSQTRTGRSARGTRIYERHLAGVAKGDVRIFRKTQPGIATDTAIFLLGDVSGSMSGSAIQLANQALYASAVAMQQVKGVDVAVGAFPGNQMVLRFGQRARHQEQRFNLCSTGSTPLETGVAMAHAALQRCKRPRKILLVVTDGDPDDAYRAQAAIDYAVDSGIEVMAIGIRTNAVQRFFTQWSRIDHVQELPEALMAMLSNTFGLNAAA